MIHAQSILLVKMSYIGALGWKTLTETLKYQLMFFGSDDTNIDGRWTIASCCQSWWKSENSNFSTWWNVLYLGRFLSCLNKQGALCRIHYVGVWCTPCLESSLPKKKKNGKQGTMQKQPLSCEPAEESNFWTIDPGNKFQFTRQKFAHKMWLGLDYI